jgi:enoyl-CoA hydratase/carnithine racemase
LQYSCIVYERIGAAAIITLSRPERLNAYVSEMRVEINHALHCAEHDNEVRAVVFTGAGRGFCSGLDMTPGLVTTLPPLDGEPYAELPTEGRLTMAIYDIPKPVIAAINGPAIGLGAAMTLPMDIRLASTEARIGFTFTRLGFAPEMASSWFLPRIIGATRASEWLITGRTLNAERALEWGFVSEVLSPERLLPRALELAEEIAGASPLSVAVARRMCQRYAHLETPQEVLKRDGDIVRARFRSADSEEASAARREKRAPAFPEPVTRAALERFGLG